MVHFPISFINLLECKTTLKRDICSQLIVFVLFVNSLYLTMLHQLNGSIVLYILEATFMDEATSDFSKLAKMMMHDESENDHVGDTVVNMVEL